MNRSNKIKISQTGVFTLLLIFIAGMAVAKNNRSATDQRPVVSVWNYDQMLLACESLKKGEDTYRLPYAKLVQDAEQILNGRATSVMDKSDNKVAISGDKHDFISVGKYCWPNPKTPDGMPWIQRDGYVNVKNFIKDDAIRQDKMCNSVVKLCIAWYFSRDDRFAAKAMELASVWFIEPSTRMNPHLKYAQVIPGKDNGMGHPPGIIFGRIYITVLSGLSLIKNSPEYNKDFDSGIKKWFAEYANWLTTSETGIKVSKMINNHSISYDQQLLAIALFSGESGTASRIVGEFHQKRIFTQVEPDGKMPNELVRTKALGYSAFNVKHMIEICEMAKEINPNLYTKKIGRRALYGRCNRLFSRISRYNSGRFCSLQADR